VIEASMTGHPTQIFIRAIFGLAVAGALVGPSLSQTSFISYPPSRSLPDIAAWLQKDTPLTPAQVVDISPAAITAITASAPMGETRGFLANIASEAVDPQMLSHDGIASWSIPVEVDCERRQVRLGTMTGYRSRDLHSESRVVRDADMTWVNPTPSAPLGAVIRALCDRDFKRPLAGHVKLAANSADAGKAAARPAKPGKLPIIVAPPPTPKAPRKETAEAKSAAPGAPEDAKPATTPAAPPAPPPAAVALAPAPPPAPARPASPQAAPATAMASAAAPAPAKPKPKPKPPAGGGAFALQIGASPSVTDAQGLVAKFKKKFGAVLGGLTTGVTSAQVDGKTVNRVLVTGFATAAEASAFCKTLEAEHQACFVRR
jgi:hypothetical protein